jgi:hypothetical protein
MSKRSPAKSWRESERDAREQLERSRRNQQRRESRG